MLTARSAQDGDGADPRRVDVRDQMLAATARALSLVLLAATLAACNDRLGSGKDDTPPDDMAVALPDLAQVGCDDAHLCGPDQRCHLAACIPDNGTCAPADGEGGDVDCMNDSYCDCPAGTDGGGGAACVCVPWGDAPRDAWDGQCRRPSYRLSDVVTPTLLCQYSADGAETSPLVGDLDGDGKPEIVFMTVSGGMHAMHGEDCSTFFDAKFEFAEWNASQLAMADLDADGRPEIVGVDRSRRVAVFDNMGSLLASSQLPYAFDDGVEELGGVAIADIDGTSPPEIVLAGQVLRYVSKPKPALKQVWVRTPVVPFWGTLTAVADINGDGVPELLAGRQVWFGANGTDLTPRALASLDGPGAWPAVADFNLDGKPDLALVLAGRDVRRIAVYDFAHARFLFGPVEGSETWGGPPVVADFDGDGFVEIGVGGIDTFTAYSPECVGQRRPPKCAKGGLPGVMWARTIQDHSSGSSGAAAFDFNGDGAFEIVYRDECWLRALDGRTGKALFAVPVTSATGVEVPPIADVDGNGHADIIVSSTAYPQCPGTDDAETGAKWVGVTNGVMVYSDPARKWMPARPIWNQHTYHVTNVNDDLTVPAQEVPGWTKWNGYRQNEQGIAGKPNGIGDFTAHATVMTTDVGPMDCVARWTQWADVCNRGGGTVQRGVPGTFYLSDPRRGGATPLCTAFTTRALQPGDCQTVSCDWLNPTTIRADIWFRADDNGSAGAAREECHGYNDLLLEKSQRCHPLM